MTNPNLKAVPAQTLPRKALPTDTLTIDGVEVTVRSLTRSQALHLTTAFQPEDPTQLEECVTRAEIYMLMHGVGVSEEEATAWREESDPEVTTQVLDRIIKLTGLTPPKKTEDDTTEDPKA